MSMDSVNLIETKVVDHSTPFTDMAKLIKHNMVSGNFAGAFVIFPPGDGEVPITTLFLDSKQDAGQFWGTLQTKCKMALDEIAARERQGGWGGR